MQRRGNAAIAVSRISVGCIPPSMNDLGLNQNRQVKKRLTMERRVI